MKHSDNAPAKVQAKFAAAVRFHRNKLGLTQMDVAHRAKLHRTYISDVERGARNVTLITMDRLACALHISIGDFFASTLWSQPDGVNTAHCFKPAICSAVALDNGTKAAEDNRNIEISRFLQLFKANEDDLQVIIFNSSSSCRVLVGEAKASASLSAASPSPPASSSTTKGTPE
jgi:transcriptional regulator with XRE-family HTH domain